MVDRTIELTDEQIERAWQLTLAMVAGENRAKLDMMYLTAARFVERMGDLETHGSVILDTGKRDQSGPVRYEVRRKG